MAAAAQESGEAVQAASTTSPSDSTTSPSDGPTVVVNAAVWIQRRAVDCASGVSKRGIVRRTTPAQWLPHTCVSHLGRAAAAREQQAVGLPEAVVA